MTHLDELLSVYLDGEATTSEATRVETHLSQCHRCRRRLQDVNSARTAVRSLPTLELPPGLLATTDREPVPGGRRPAVWVGAAAAVMALIVAVAAIVTPAPEPLDIDHVSLQLDARSSVDVGLAPLKVVVPAQEAE